MNPHPSRALSRAASRVRRTVPAVVVVALAVVAVGSVSATAGALVTGAQIKNGTVTTKDVKDGNLKLADLSPAALSGLSGATGPAGAPGAAGTPGAKGVSGYEIALNTISVADGATSSVTATCPAGKLAVGGGFTFTGGVTTQLSAATDAGGNFLTTSPRTAWTVRVANTSGSSRSVFVQAVCVLAP